MVWLGFGTKENLVRFRKRFSLGKDLRRHGYDNKHTVQQLRLGL